MCLEAIIRVCVCVCVWWERVTEREIVQYVCMKGRVIVFILWLITLYAIVESLVAVPNPEVAMCSCTSVSNV